MPSPKKPAAPLPTLAFDSQSSFHAWLAENHTTSPGLWLKLAKKSSGTPSVTYLEAVDSALCHGWIDGQKNALDDTAWLQKFTPRGPRSIWSKINREKVAALIASGRMTPAGHAEIDRAKKDGRWDQAYDSPSSITVPPDLTAALDASPKAKAFYATLNKANTYAILWRIHTAKLPETRARRISQLVDMLSRGEKLHP